MIDIQLKYKNALIAVTGSIALGYLVYKAIKSFEVGGQGSKKIKKVREHLIDLLQAFNEDDIEKEDLIATLKRLCDQSAFSEIQDQIRTLGYLPKIINTVKYPDYDVQYQGALLINNLAMNVQNQLILKESIPALILILCKNAIKEETVNLFTAVLCALTNLTVLDDSHPTLIPRMGIFFELLTQCELVQIKLQVLKILVNVSTNKKNCENDYELAAMMIRSIERFVTTQEEERFLLRAVCCCANVLEALHCRWQHGAHPHVTTPEFVNDKLHTNLIRLSTHINEDIHKHAMRALQALRPPPLATSSPTAASGDNNNTLVGAMENLDLLEVLKI